MPTLITSENTTELRVHSFIASASDLELPVSIRQWPEMLETNLGNGRPFLRSLAAKYEVHYRQEFGCIQLTIFND